MISSPDSPWWLSQTIRLLQPNLRLTDGSALSSARLIERLLDFKANALLINCGGIFAHYPTSLRWHSPHPGLPSGKDLFGEVRQATRQQGIRLIARFDFSKTTALPVHAHPEWYFRRSDGSHACLAETYATCINGPYYREYALRILHEAMDRYEPDGIFINMFGNPSHDYARQPLGPCHCASCRTAYKSHVGQALPAQRGDQSYESFLQRCSSEVIDQYRGAIKDRLPNAAFITYRREGVDAIASEANTFFDHPLPLWPYHASDNVERSRSHHPDKLAFNICIGFADYTARLSAISPHHARLRHWQNLAHGTGLLYAAIGSLDLEDPTALNASREIYRWQAKNHHHYQQLENQGRVALLATGSPNAPSYRGLFRLLSELHLPFVAFDQADALARGIGRFDLVVCDGPIPNDFETWIRQGGRSLTVSAEATSFALPQPVSIETETASSYWRIRDPRRFPRLEDTQLAFASGPIALLPEDRAAELAWIPPTPTGPPELVFQGAVETRRPGFLCQSHGQGQLAWFPWELGALYYQQSSPAHQALFAGAVDSLLPGPRQLITDAHPLIEIVWTRSQETGHHLIHLINTSGHSGTAYHQPLPMNSLTFDLAGNFRHARCLRAAQDLPLRTEDDRTCLTLPHLADYEALHLE